MGSYSERNEEKMWKNEMNLMPMGFSTPPSTKNFIPSHNSVMKNSMSEGKCLTSPWIKCDLFHVIHKVPAGDSPYVKAKQVQVSSFCTLFLF